MSIIKAFIFAAFATALILGPGRAFFAGTIPAAMAQAGPYETLLEKRQREAREGERAPSPESGVPDHDVFIHPQSAVTNPPQAEDAQEAEDITEREPPARDQLKHRTYETIERLYTEDSPSPPPEKPVQEPLSDSTAPEAAPAPAEDAAPHAETPESRNYDGYLLGPGDRLKITVYGEDDLSGSFAVNDAGQISFPLIGEIHVQDLKVLEARDLISRKLKDGYLKDPNIAIEVEEFRPFYIVGEVRTPGSYSYVAGMTVMNAVALAGGFTYRANKKEAKVLRKAHGDATLKDDLPIGAPVMPGDIIFIKERFF